MPSNVLSWEDDPGSALGVIDVPAPDLNVAPYALKIEGSPPRNSMSKVLRSFVSQEPHSFSRAFTDAFLEAFAGMVLTNSPTPTADGFARRQSSDGKAAGHRSAKRAGGAGIL
jgi:hypothetical protein